MSRAGRPSARGAHKRNLIGPTETLRRIEEQGGVPEAVVEDLKTPKPQNPRAETANEAAIEAIQKARKIVASKGIEHEMVERRDPRDDPGAVDREMAWFLSVTNAMKESAPRKTWCRHMRAADPHLNELRTAALISKGVWMCVECIREAGPDALNANPWPDECDLCGATMTAGHFNEMAFNIPGCFVNCTVCDECYGFNKERTKPSQQT
jgi:hypothetical protein